VSLDGASPNLFVRVARELESLVAQQSMSEAAHSTASSPEFAADLERLGNLHERGLLTEAEYADAKARVLRGSRPPSSGLTPCATPASSFDSNDPSSQSIS
jgi:hypothetical protein